jgi:hypothetical protein
LGLVGKLGCDREARDPEGKVGWQLGARCSKNPLVPMKVATMCLGACESGGTDIDLWCERIASLRYWGNREGNREASERL